MNPPIPPRPDYNGPPPAVPPHHRGDRAPPPAPERTSSHSAVSSSSSSRSSRRAGGSEPPLPPPPIPTGGGVPDPDWEAREEVRQQELNEARARAAQMEKTMRWWSDCTANWREKWSKVRNERNKARDEVRHLRAKLEAASKRLEEMKEDKGSLSTEVGRLKRQVEALQGPGADKERASVCSSSGSHKSGAGSDQETQPMPGEHTSAGGVGDLADGDMIGASASQEDFVSKLLSKKDKDSGSKDLESSSSGHSERSSDKRKQASGSKPEASPDLDTMVQEKMSKLRRKLEDAHKAMQTEAQEKTQLMTTLKKAEEELGNMKDKYDDLQISRQHALDELNKLRASHQDELGRITTELQDEALSRTDMDKRLAELRKELERLQAENASEWARREQLETDKLALERENKRLRSELDSANEEVEKHRKQASVTADSDLKTLHLELEAKTKELGDVRHAYSKQKKVMAELSSELDHSRSRAEQYEVEVRKVRGRVDELKHALATAEDEVDHQTHQTRKLQRSNDELQQQVENLQVQVQHLHTSDDQFDKIIRDLSEFAQSPLGVLPDVATAPQSPNNPQSLRRSSNPLLSTRASSLKSYEDNNDSATDIASEEDTENKAEAPED